MKRMLIAALSIISLNAIAQDRSPVGLWKSIDDETGKPKALIRITESNGELKGVIEKVFRVAEDGKAPTCDKCEGAKKDQPIVGMTILWGMKPEGSEYNGGQILDPSNGKTYKSKLAFADSDKKLKVRGYIGTPMLGRTQVWMRDE